MPIFKMLIFAVVIACTMFMNGIAEAGPDGPVDEARRVDMIAHPDRYVKSTGIGTGAVLYIDKASICVEKYEPPHYIIKFNTFVVSYPASGGWQPHEVIENRIYYNWNDRKAYMYRMNSSAGENRWEEISRQSTYLWRFTRVADDVFRCAYNMDFFPSDKR